MASFTQIDQIRPKSERKLCEVIFARTLRVRGYDLEALAERVEEIFGMEPGEVYFAGKYQRLIRPRSVFCYWAVRELGETATSLAKRLNITQAGVSKSVLRGESIVREMNLKLL